MNTQIVSIREAKSKFSELASRAAGRRERFLVTNHGKPVAAIIASDDLDLLEKTVRTSGHKNHIARFAGVFKKQRHWEGIEKMLLQAREASKGEAPVVLD